MVYKNCIHQENKGNENCSRYCVCGDDEDHICDKNKFEFDSATCLAPCGSSPFTKHSPTPSPIPKNNNEAPKHATIWKEVLEKDLKPIKCSVVNEKYCTYQKKGKCICKPEKIKYKDKSNCGIESTMWNEIWSDIQKKKLTDFAKQFRTKKAKTSQRTEPIEFSSKNKPKFIQNKYDPQLNNFQKPMTESKMVQKINDCQQYVTQKQPKCDCTWLTQCCCDINSNEVSNSVSNKPQKIPTKEPKIVSNVKPKCMCTWLTECCCNIDNNNVSSNSTNNTFDSGKKVLEVCMCPVNDELKDATNKDFKYKEEKSQDKKANDQTKGAPCICSCNLETCVCSFFDDLKDTKTENCQKSEEKCRCGCNVDQCTCKSIDGNITSEIYCNCGCNIEKCGCLIKDESLQVDNKEDQKESIKTKITLTKESQHFESVTAKCEKCGLNTTVCICNLKSELEREKEVKKIEETIPEQTQSQGICDCSCDVQGCTCTTFEKKKKRKGRDLKKDRIKSCKKKNIPSKKNKNKKDGTNDFKKICCCGCQIEDCICQALAADNPDIQDDDSEDRSCFCGCNIKECRCNKKNINETESECNISKLYAAKTNLFGIKFNYYKLRDAVREQNSECVCDCDLQNCICREILKLLKSKSYNKIKSVASKIEKNYCAICGRFDCLCSNSVSNS